VKRIITLTLTLAVMALLVSGAEKEITLFDSDGDAAAYLAIEDKDTAIYLWSGEPVAYLGKPDRDGYSIYGFNGKHLGWYDKGVVRDHDGYVVGFAKGAIEKITKIEPIKGIKKFAPFKAFEEFAPFRPFDQNRFSQETLSLFLRRGRS